MDSKSPDEIAALVDNEGERGCNLAQLEIGSPDRLAPSGAGSIALYSTSGEFVKTLRFGCIGCGGMGTVHVLNSKYVPGMGLCG